MPLVLAPGEVGTAFLVILRSLSFLFPRLRSSYLSNVPRSFDHLVASL